MTRPGPARGSFYQLISLADWTSLPRLRRPALILAGDDDPVIPLTNARIMHRLMPRSDLHIYHGSLRVGSASSGRGPDRTGDSAVMPAPGAGDDVQPGILPAGVRWARACRSSAAAR